VPTIRHLVEFAAPPERVFPAVSTRDGFAEWWNRKVSGDTELGGQGLTFEFPGSTHTWRTLVREPDRVFEMECLSDTGGPEWVGTRLRFEIDPTDQGCTLRFNHIDWREATEFHGHCSYVWTFFLRGLKRWIEDGVGSPAYGDQPITI